MVRFRRIVSGMSYTKAKTRGAQTATRALRMLEILVEAQRPVSAKELTELSGFHVNVTYRLISALEDAGLRPEMHERGVRDRAKTHRLVGEGGKRAEHSRSGVTNHASTRGGDVRDGHLTHTERW